MTMAECVKIYSKKRQVWKAKVYKSMLFLAKGLRFSKSLQKNQALLLVSSQENLQTIDMLFVFFPIDALWLDKDKKVIHIVRNIKPWTLAVSPPKPARYILECLANSTQKIRLKDQFSFKIHQ